MAARDKKPEVKTISAEELAAVGHEAHRVFRASKNSEGNIPVFESLPGEMKAAWAAAAQAIAQVASTGHVPAGPDPEWSKEDRAVLGSVLREKRAAVIASAKEAEQAPDGAVLDGLDSCLAKLGAS